VLRALLTTLGAVLALVAVVGIGNGIRALAGRQAPSVFGLLLVAYLVTLAALWISGSLSGGARYWAEDDEPSCAGPPAATC
jgi:hypothetical protein